MFKTITYQQIVPQMVLTNKPIPIQPSNTMTTRVAQRCLRTLWNSSNLHLLPPQLTNNLTKAQLCFSMNWLILKQLIKKILRLFNFLDLVLILAAIIKHIMVLNKHIIIILIVYNREMGQINQEIQICKILHNK